MKIRSGVLAGLMIIAALPIAASGRSEQPVDASEAVSHYEAGELQEAADIFRRIAQTGNAAESSAAYYNHGTIQAEIAASEEDPARKRELLESSFESLKRSADIGGLPGPQQRHARQNMELVREQLSQLPEQSEEQQQQQQQQQSEQQQSGQQQSEQQQSGQQQSGQQQQDSGQEGGSTQQGSPAEQQQALREQTESGQGNEADLARRQQELQQQSGEAGRQDAAVEQQKAADALGRGDREKAAEHQRKAEQMLRAAEAQEAGHDEGARQEADNILNREAERRAEKNRLDRSGGISEAERNW